MKLSRLKERFSLKPVEEKTLITSKVLTLTTNRNTLWIGGIIAVLLLGLVAVNSAVYFREDVPHGLLLYVLSYVGALITGCLLAFKWNLSEWIGKPIQILSIWILPIITMAYVECLNGVFIFNWETKAWILNCIFYSLLYLAIFTVSGSYRLPFLIVNPILFLLSLTNHYVFAFRGTPFLPMDFLAASTAANVADAYDFSFNYQIVVSIILFVFTLAAAWNIKTPSRKLYKKIIIRVLAGVISFGILINYYASDYLAEAGLRPDFFNQERSYHLTGVPYNFFLNTKYLTVDVPQGYGSENIDEIVANVLSDSNGSESTSEEAPNIICIMNESLSDLRVLGDLKTNKDYIPYMRSLTENTVKGNLYVPVIGAGTSNSEFEFLTGTTTAFLPTGSNAYTLYVKDSLSTLTTTLKDQGYSSRAFHPYYAENWNRPSVYKHMGFDQYDGMELFFSQKIISAYKDGSTYENLKKMAVDAFPNDPDVLLRHVVSDSYDYKKVIEMYENRNPDQPFYIFNVTMQNHGGYENTYPDFKEEIFVVDDNGNKVETYPQTNQYLSLVYESDKAFKELIAYFEAQDEPTVICMFGDHQPSIEDEFVAELLEAKSIYSLDIKQTQARYVTPFYIWANYDVEEKEIDKLSANYLSSYLLDIAGLNMPIYNQYLLKLSETLPVIDTVGYIDAQGNYYVHGQKTPYAELLEGYEHVCYNHLFDKKAKCDWLFEMKE